MQRRAWLVLLVSACGGAPDGTTTARPAGPPPSTGAPRSDHAGRPPASPGAPPAPAVSATCTAQASQLAHEMRDLSRAQPGFLPMVLVK